MMALKLSVHVRYIGTCTEKTFILSMLNICIFHKWRKVLLINLAKNAVFIKLFNNLLKLKLDLHTCSLFSIGGFFLVAACVGSNNTPLRVASGVNMNALSEIYISQSEIESTSQNNQSENCFLSVFGVVQKNMAASMRYDRQRFDRYFTTIWHRWVEL